MAPSGEAAEPVGAMGRGPPVVAGASGTVSPEPGVRRPRRRTTAPPRLVREAAHCFTAGPSLAFVAGGGDRERRPRPGRRQPARTLPLPVRLAGRGSPAREKPALLGDYC